MLQSWFFKEDRITNTGYSYQNNECWFTVFWYYKSRSVTFENGKVSEFSNIDGNLKIQLTGEHTRILGAENFFSLGSSKNFVLQVQGAPTRIMNASSTVFWYYGSSSVTFENSRVSEFSNIDENLKIKL